MTLVKDFKDLGIKLPESQALEGPKIEIAKLFGKQITVHAFRIGPSKHPDELGAKCLTLQITVDGTKRVVFTGSRYLREQIEHVGPEGLPFRTVIMKQDNDSIQFT
jgi:hypothetical protein